MMKFREATQIVVYGIFIIIVLGIIFNFSGDKVVNFLLPLGIGFILSAFVGEVIEKFTGDFFKDKYLSFPILGLRVNIPLMFILTIIIKIWWFR